jgi:hypothetical protein
MQRTTDGQPPQLPPDRSVHVERAASMRQLGTTGSLGESVARLRLSDVEVSAGAEGSRPKVRPKR